MYFISFEMFVCNIIICNDYYIYDFNNILAIFFYFIFVTWHLLSTHYISRFITSKRVFILLENNMKRIRSSE